MAQKPQNDPSYDKARDLAEEALDAYVKGNPKEGDKLAEQAKRTNAEAAQDVVNDLEEDRNADHSSHVGSGEEANKDRGRD
ncbi:MAG TPA: hypothetical protein VHO91_10925 [Rhodopila sp.]|nr:hypothetical protein [Rhodopila sp.]